MGIQLAQVEAAASAGLVVCIVVGVVLLVPVIWLTVVYNRFAKLRQTVRESFSGIDVELKRRHDLIPNLVATVQGYAAHERDTITAVIEARARAMAPHGNAVDTITSEQTLGKSLGRLLAVAENYPTLKADKNFLELQRELSLTEDRLAASRRFYNGNVREMNALCVSFPTNVIGGVFGFESQAFFELDSPSERNLPPAKFER